VNRVATLRTFLALTLEPAALDRVAQCQEQLRKQLKPRAEALRPMRPDQLHVTLAFLVDTPTDLVPELRSLVEQVALHHQPLSLPVEHVTFLPKPMRSRVVALGLSEPKGRAESLASELWHGLVALGWSREQRRFLPHITLFRSRNPVPIEPWPEAGLAPAVGDIVLRLGQIAHYASVLEASGARYELLSATPLGIPLP
jgi:2'-5' RNA ligase